MEASFRHLIVSRKEIMPTPRGLRTIKAIWMGVSVRCVAQVVPRWSDPRDAQYGLTTWVRFAGATWQQTQIAYS